MNKLLIFNALIWAAVILLCAYWFKDSANYSYLFSTLLIGAGLQNAITYSLLKKGSKKD